MLSILLILLLYAAVGLGYRLHPEDYPIHTIEEVTHDMTARNVSTCAVQLQRISNGELAFQYFEDGVIHFFRNHYLFDDLVSDIGRITWETSPHGHLHLLTFNSLPNHPYYEYLRKDVKVPRTVANVSHMEELKYQLKAKEAAQYAGYRDWKPGQPFIQISLPPVRDPRVPTNYVQSMPYARRQNIYNGISLEYKKATQTRLGRQCMPYEGMRPLLKEQNVLFNMVSGGKMYVNYTGTYLYPACGITLEELYTSGQNTAPTGYFIKLLDADVDNTTYPGKVGFIEKVTSRIWVVDYYSDWAGLASVHGPVIFELTARYYRTGVWSEVCYHDLRMYGNPFMHEVMHNGGSPHGFGVGVTAPFHRFIANHRQGERFNVGVFDCMSGGGYPFISSAQGASHYYNSWETILPRWRRVLKHWDDGIIPEVNVPGKERRYPHGGGSKDIGMHYLRIMDVEHQYSYKFVGADEEAYMNVTFANYSLNPVFSSLVRHDQQAWIGFNDGFDPEDIILGLKRKDHLIMIEVYLDKAGFYSEMNSDFLSILIEYRSNNRMSFNGQSVHFLSLRPAAYESNEPVNLLNACVELNQNDAINAEQGTAATLPGRVWTCPDCDIGTFQVMVIDGNYVNNDPFNFSMFYENRHENVLDMPYRNIAINYTPNSLPVPPPKPHFYPIRFQDSPGSHCYLYNGNISTTPERVLNITCDTMMKLNEYVSDLFVISHYYLNDPYNGLIRRYHDVRATLSTYRSFSTRLSEMECVNRDTSGNNAKKRMTKFGGVAANDGYFLYGRVAEIVAGASQGFPYIDFFYDSNITAVFRNNKDDSTVYKVISRGPTNFTNRIGWSMADYRRVEFEKQVENGYIIMFDSSWNPILYFILDHYPKDYFGSNPRAEMYYLIFPFPYTNARCNYVQYAYSFNGSSHKAGVFAGAFKSQMPENSKDRVLVSNISYERQTFRLLPEGFSFEQRYGCWSHHNRPTLYKANQWHMIEMPGSSRKNWLLAIDFDSIIPDNLIIYADSYNTTTAIDLRLLSVLNHMSNSGNANNRTIYWTYVMDNYLMTREYYYSYTENGEHPSLRFAFNKDVTLFNVRFISPRFTMDSIRDYGTVNNCGRIMKLTKTNLDDNSHVVQPTVVPYSINLNGTEYIFENSNTAFDVPFPIPLRKGLFATPHKIGHYYPNLPSCKPGTYAWRLQTGKFECLICPRGYFCEEGILNACPPGYYSDEEGLAECKIYSEAARNYKFNEIPSTDFYAAIDYSKFPIRNRDGSVFGFYSCSANMFMINGTCMPCPVTGYICVPGMDAVICPKGFRCGAGHAQPCVREEYQDEEGQELCKKYPKGTTKLTCSNPNEFDFPLDGSYPLFRTNPVYALLIIYLMDNPNAGCRACPHGFRCSSSEIVQCAYNEYSPEGQLTCMKCPKGQIRNSNGSGCISLNAVNETEEALLVPNYRFYGFYPTYNPPADGKPIYPPPDMPENRIHLHDMHKIVHVIDDAKTVAEALAIISSQKATRALVEAMFTIGGIAAVALIAVCLVFVLKKHR